MLFNFNRFEVFVGKCIYGWYYLPRLYKIKAEVFFSWLGGCVVWSRLKRTLKDSNRVQED
jgi:hypothetical protein